MGFHFVKPKLRPRAPIVDYEKCYAEQCEGCPLYTSGARSVDMPPSGAKEPILYVLGEAPGGEEDKQNEPFVGSSGQILRKAFPQYARKSLRFSNTVRTRPPSNRDPTPEETEHCRPSVAADIIKSKPDGILAVGRLALKWFIDEDYITAWRGRRIPVRIGTHECWLFPVMHPAFLLYSPPGSPHRTTFQRDIERACEFLYDEDLYYPPTLEPLEKADKDIAIVTPDSGMAAGRIKAWLEEAGCNISAVDIETNGLRPYANGARILSLAVATSEGTLAFPYDHPHHTWDKGSRKIIEDGLRAYLFSNQTKIAQNASFELEWLAHFFGRRICRVSRWEDTMAQAYVLDERTGALNLQALCLINLGLPLKSLSNINSKKLDQEPLDHLLRYNGLDAKYEYKLFFAQKKRVEADGLKSIYDEHIRRIPSLTRMQLRGVCIDQNETRKHYLRLTKDIEDVRKKISENKDVQDFEDEQEEDYNPDSAPQTIAFFRWAGFEKQMLVKDKVTKKKRFSADKAVLSEIEHPVAAMVVTSRNRLKLRSTYVEQYAAKETVAAIGAEGIKITAAKSTLWPDGKLHTNYNSLFVATGRLSSNEPNLQNQPSRHDRELKSQFIPEPGCSFLAVDYGQLEARVIGMASQDKILCQAIREGYDIHTEWAEKLAQAYPSRIGGRRFLTDKAVMKTFRTDVKNQWTFPLFYGAALGSACHYLDIPEATLKPLYEEFWNMFSGVKDWQDGLLKFYEQNGYIETFTGRRRHAPLTENEIINSPIQGGASDIVIDAMNRLSELSEKTNNPYLEPVMNIHDDLSYYPLNENLENDVTTIIDEMVNSPYEFVTLPLSVEAKLGPNAYELEDIGTYYSKQRI